jgi:hypothetical protein
MMKSSSKEIHQLKVKKEISKEEQDKIEIAQGLKITNQKVRTISRVQDNPDQIMFCLNHHQRKMLHLNQ